jgi:iron complex transport system substrate-binding protein
MAKYFEDAGGTYVMKNIASEGNLVLPIEAVYEKALNAEYWINAGFADSKQYILNTDQRLAKIAALSNGNIYNNTAKSNKNGWSDYYESGVVNPHVILKDLIKILHPELLLDYQLQYYKKLE